MDRQSREDRRQLAPASLTANRARRPSGSPTHAARGHSTLGSRNAWLSACGTRPIAAGSVWLVSQPLSSRPLTEPHPARLPPDDPHRAEILALHAAALRASEPGYLDPQTGLFVLTAGYLADRGRCCGRGCRHCPFVE
jgi:hypothetical protein